VQYSIAFEPLGEEEDVADVGTRCVGGGTSFHDQDVHYGI
jgi:hypothetical protein